jgi:hypothetical protein
MEPGSYAVKRKNGGRGSCDGRYRNQGGHRGRYDPLESIGRANVQRPVCWAADISRRFRRRSRSSIDTAGPGISSSPANDLLAGREASPTGCKGGASTAQLCFRRESGSVPPPGPCSSASEAIPWTGATGTTLSRVCSCHPPGVANSSRTKSDRPATRAVVPASAHTMPMRSRHAPHGVAPSVLRGIAWVGVRATSRLAGHSRPIADTVRAAAVVVRRGFSGTVHVSIRALCARLLFPTSEEARI